MPKDPQSDIPARFRVAKATLLMDRFMNQFIKVGGLSIIVAVFAIFVFILAQIVPLFRGAKVEELKAVQLDAADYGIIGIDEWSELPFALRTDGELLFTDVVGDRGLVRKSLPFIAEHGFGAADYDQRAQRLAVGTRDGKFALVELGYRPAYGPGGARSITADPRPGRLYDIGRPGAPVTHIAYADAGARKLAVVKQEPAEAGGPRELHAVSLTQRRALVGGGQIAIDRSFDLTALVPGTIDRFLVPAQADAVVVATTAGEIVYLFREGDTFVVRQTFRPFPETPGPLSVFDFVFGDVTLVVGDSAGALKGYSLYLDPSVNQRRFGHTKTFPEQAAPGTVFAASVRNKAFVVGSGSRAELLYSTTEDRRWAKSFDFAVTHAVVAGKYDHMVFLDDKHLLHFYRLDDPHPEASFRAFFGKLWYEGAPEPRYDWQSTGGSDDFEPKLSLVPLVVGSLKGTFYALVFAVPIALLAAIYTSQFLKPEIKTAVKPVMEIMASLPSVVLGFLAALWLAPLVETRIPSIILLVTLVPLSAVAFGYFWTHLSPRFRVLIPHGWEFLVFIPVLLGVGWFAWQFGPAMERVLFVVTDPASGARVADFRLWWPTVTGTPFEQRNSLVVGFMMGFAVIPIIFTISEDALSNVPQSLRSGSLALGASRWQTAFRIVLPTASAGIFSALMIGLGRAVGETMIVVMATGNTPIMEWNIFSGMRTLAANIAVELPEAPHHGTLYRTLFLGAMVLFLLTFLVNTLAEVLRQRLRSRYRSVE